jgi:hypothetical protein
MTGPVHWWPGKDSWRVLSGPEEGWSRSRSPAAAAAAAAASASAQAQLYPKVSTPGPQNRQ